MKYLAFFFLAATCLVASAQNKKAYLLKVGKLYDSEKNIFINDQETLLIS